MLQQLALRLSSPSIFLSLFFHTATKRGIFLTFSTSYSLTVTSQCQHSADNHLSTAIVSYYCSVFIKVIERNKVITFTKKKNLAFLKPEVYLYFWPIPQKDKLSEEHGRCKQRRGPLINLSGILTYFTCNLERTAMDITLFQ